MNNTYYNKLERTLESKGDANMDQAAMRAQAAENASRNAKLQMLAELAAQRDAAKKAAGTQQSGSSSDLTHMIRMPSPSKSGSSSQESGSSSRPGRPVINGRAAPPSVSKDIAKRIKQDKNQMIRAQRAENRENRAIKRENNQAIRERRAENRANNQAIRAKRKARKHARMTRKAARGQAGEV